MREYEFWEILRGYDKRLKMQRVKRLLNDIEGRGREPVSEDDVLNIRIDMSKINTIEELIVYFNGKGE